MIKKVIRLTESDLLKTIKKIIREEEFNHYEDYLTKLNIIEDSVDQTETLPQSRIESYLRKLNRMFYDIEEDKQLSKNEKEKLLRKWDFISEKISDRLSEPE